MVKGPVIAGIDGSAESLQAAALAWRIAQAARVRLILGFAVPGMPGPDAVVKSINAAELRDRMIRAVRQELGRSGTQAGLPPSIIDSLVTRPGRPGDVLNTMTHAYHAQLVVVGGQRRGPIARNFGGSTAHHLARTAECPVLVVGPGQTPPRRVLAAVDLSAASGPTLAAAAHYARLLEAQLRVLYVVEPIRHVSPVPRVLDSAEVAGRARVAFEKLLEAELPDLPSAERAVRSGLPDEAIAEEAADSQADVIAIGTQGKGLIDRMLIGSTTERLLNRLPASLLIVPGRRAAPKRRAVKPKRRAVRTGRAR